MNPTPTNQTDENTPLAGFTAEPLPVDKEWVLFSSRYKTSDFDRQPLPADIFSAEKVIRARKGQLVPKDRLGNSYILVDKKVDAASGPELKKRIPGQI
ncbi:MAG: hypothetical protein JNM63_04620, partial [Spirochaetia bacterium]|nr:hypothetical protein [Spirochaetia bacterium]